MVNNTDCNDQSKTVYPGAVEVCDSVDNDCDDETDEPDAIDSIRWYRDSDGDRFGAAAFAIRSCTRPMPFFANPYDCDDANGAVTVCDTVCPDPNDPLVNRISAGECTDPPSCDTGEATFTHPTCGCGCVAAEVVPAS